MRAKFPFFIVGAQRSGSTLLRMLLNSHELIAVPEEARFLTPLLTTRFWRAGLDDAAVRHVCRYLAVNEEYALWNYDSAPALKMISDLGATSVAGFVDQLYGSYAASEGKPLWGDKSLFFRNIGLLSEMFPTSTFIHIVRDGRDVFDSWRKFDPGKDNVAMAALDWRIKTGLIEHAFSRLGRKRTLTVRYEDLIEDCEGTCRRLCKFLEIPFDAGMLEFYRRSRRYVGEHHSQLIFRPVEAANQGKWLLNLTPAEASVYAMLSRSALKRYNYAGSVTGISLSSQAALLAGAATGALRRAGEVVADWAERRRAFHDETPTRGIKVGARPSAVADG